VAGLSAEQIASTDSANQAADILAMPQHLEDALWRVESAGIEGCLPTLRGLTPLIVCGMGGSAIGGDLAEAALDSRLTKPLITMRGYELPTWATRDSVVLCASYSGNTEETLACYEAAGVIGTQRVVVTTGGRLAELARADDVPVIPLPAALQPRAAVAYMLVSVIEVARLVGAAPGLRTEIDAAASHLQELARAWGPEADSDSLAKRVAQRIHKTSICVYGAGPTASVARRWKTQLNENAKIPAFFAELPEANHNEIVGWSGASEIGSFTAIFLEDVDQHPRVGQRIDLTSKLIESDAAATLRLESQGTNPVERLLSLVLLGDFVSLYLAVLQGIDPSPVEVIERLKAELAEEPVA
jgi:glucose/mannose-6-phosphate isomerase